MGLFLMRDAEMVMTSFLAAIAIGQRGAPMGAAELTPEFRRLAEELIAPGVPTGQGGDLRLAVLKGAILPSKGKPALSAVWVISDPEESPIRVVGMNGLLYEAESLGEKIDADAWLDEKADGGVPRKTMLVVQGGVQHQEMSSVLSGGPRENWALTAAAVLLRAGHEDAAKMVLKSTYISGSSEDALARTYLAAAQNRLAYRYAAGDYSGALEAVDLARPVRRHFIGRLGDKTEPAQMTGVPFAELEQFETLRQDVRRRLKEGPHKRLDLEEFLAMDKDRQVSELIARLDDDPQIAATGSRFYGSIMLAPSLDESAIEPLLKVVRDDTRFSRSAMGPGQNRGSLLFPVWRNAANLIKQILQNPPVPITTQAETAEALSAFWNAAKGGSADERFVRILDSDTGLAMWTWAVGQLAARHPNGQGLSAGQRDRIRSRASEIIRAHMDDAGGAARPQGRSVFTFHRSFAALDRETAGETAKELSRVLLTQMGQYGAGGRGTGRFSESRNLLGSLVLLRLERGDESAAKDYLSVMGETDKNVPPSSVEMAFRPLILRPDVPEFAAYMETAFAEGGPWENVLAEPFMRRHAGSRLLLVPSYRRLVIEGLRDDTVVGTATFDGQMYNYNLREGIEGGRGFGGAEPSGEPSEPAEGELVVRARDLWATDLEQAWLDDAPSYRPYWSSVRRAEAIRDWIDLLENRPGDLAQMFRARSRGFRDPQWDFPS